MIYELMDMESGNLLGAYDSELEALRFVRGIIEEHGGDWLTSVALISDDELGRGSVLAEGETLLQRAMSIAA